MWFKSLFLFSLCITILCCQKKEKAISLQETTIADFPKVNDKTDFIGLYQGILPCADCEGMDVRIALNENGTYTKLVNYQGKGAKFFEQKGTFRWNNLGNVVILENVANQPNQYLVTDNKLIQLDQKGNVTQSDMNSQYELEKIPENLVQKYERNNTMDVVDLNSTIESSAEIKQVNPANGKHTLASTQWNLAYLKGKKIKSNSKKPFHIIMKSNDGTFSAFAGCNGIFGNYIMPKSDEISFLEINSTMIACDDMSLENEFSRMLSETKSYSLENETLHFYGSGKSPIATFVANK